MNKTEIKQLIHEKILKVEQKVAMYQDMTQPISPENAIGRVSRMDAINSKSVAEAALRQAKQDLKALNNVLLNIDKDDFGNCLKCKTQIPIGRILLKPEIPYCVNCAK